MADRNVTLLLDRLRGGKRGLLPNECPNCGHLHTISFRGPLELDCEEAGDLLADIRQLVEYEYKISDHAPGLVLNSIAQVLEGDHTVFPHEHDWTRFEGPVVEGELCLICNSIRALQPSDVRGGRP